MKTCADCKYHCIKFSSNQKIDSDLILIGKNSESVLGDMYGKCESGNNEQFKEFWKKYGNAPKSSYTDIEYPCFKATEEAEALDKLINLVDKTLDAIKK